MLFFFLILCVVCHLSCREPVCHPGSPSAARSEACAPSPACAALQVSHRCAREATRCGFLFALDYVASIQSLKSFGCVPLRVQGSPLSPSFFSSTFSPSPSWLVHCCSRCSRDLLLHLGEAMNHESMPCSVWMQDKQRLIMEADRVISGCCCLSAGRWPLRRFGIC